MKRTSVVKSSPYYVSKYRQLELKYFVMQYDEKKKAMSDIRLRFGNDPTGEEGLYLASLSEDVSMISDIATELDTKGYLLEGVTKNLSYDVLTARHGVLPYSRRVYYNLYRRFFKHLDSRRKHHL